MKRYILSIAALLIAAISLHAEAVSEQQAREFARNYLGINQPVLAFRTLDSGLTKAAAEPSVFAFNNPSGGWVIISADDCSVPVLAHSDKGSISLENMPDNMRGFLSSAAANIMKVSKAKVAVPAAIKAEWASQGVRTKGGSPAQKILQTAQWDQNSPFNNTVKSVLGTTQELATGCVPTAMSIICQYHKWPQKGTGVIPAYNCSFAVPEVDISSYTYDWSKMPLTTPSTPDQISAVADLMFHCGAMMQAKYGVGNTSAIDADILPAMLKYLSYSPKARFIRRSVYPTFDWLKMIQADIDASNPVFYGGQDIYNRGGHGFIIDGYNSIGEVHVNWGWGDYFNNGWYAINYLGDDDPYFINHVFSYFDYAIIGLAPATGTESGQYNLYLHSYLEGGNEYYGFQVSSGKIAQGSSFSISALIFDGSINDYNGALKVGLFSKDGTLKESISNSRDFQVKAPGPGYIGVTEVNNIACKITGTIAPGDYVGMLYKASDDSWVQMGAETDPFQGVYSIGKISATGVSYIYAPSTLSAGDKFYLDYVGSGKLPVSFKWTYDGTDINPGYQAFTAVTLTSGTHTVKLVVTYRDSSTETLVRKLVVD